MTTDTTVYKEEIEAWRATIEEPLRRDWVSLVGLVELEPGLSRIGADPESEVALPAESAPDRLGVIALADGIVTLALEPGVPVFVNGVQVDGSISLRSDAEGTPDLVTHGSLTFFIIQRGDRTLVRIRDANSPLLRRFAGRRWFAADETYRVEGVFTPYDPPRPLSITNLLGDTSSPTSPGTVTFRLAGEAYSLDATGWRDGGLVLHFRDATNGALTYNAGRSVVTTAPQNGLVTVDFNRTTNLPCAFTEFATCPLPPQQNRLSIPISAGELRPDLPEQERANGNG